MWLEGGGCKYLGGGATRPVAGEGGEGVMDAALVESRGEHGSRGQAGFGVGEKPPCGCRSSSTCE